MKKYKIFLIDGSIFEADAESFRESEDTYVFYSDEEEDDEVAEFKLEFVKAVIVANKVKEIKKAETIIEIPSKRLQKIED